MFSGREGKIEGKVRGKRAKCWVALALSFFSLGCSASRYEIREVPGAPYIIERATGAVVLDSLSDPLAVADVEEEMGCGNRIRRVVILVPLLSMSGLVAGFAIGTVLDPPGYQRCDVFCLNISHGQGSGMTIGFFGGGLLAIYDALTVGKQKDFDDAVDRLRKR
jgi:hypothetical protein